jgi:hypothetical protein
MNIETIITISGLLVCCTVAYLLYYSSVHWLIKLVSLPITLVFTATMVYTAYDRMGAPIERMPVGEFEYVHHSVSSAGDFIYIWVYTDERGNRLHAVPYDRETAKELNQAKKQEEKGEEMVGEFSMEEESSESSKRERQQLRVSPDTIKIDNEDFTK